jgi:hypothetical protein
MEKDLRLGSRVMNSRTIVEVPRVSSGALLRRAPVSTGFGFGDPRFYDGFPQSSAMLCNLSQSR